MGNLTDALSGSVTPRLRREFQFSVVDVSYTRGFLDYKQSGDIANLTSDADTQEKRVSLASPDDDRFISWGAEYSEQTTEFDSGAQRFEFEQASASSVFA
ncbi:MAG: hypothetical protein HC872_09735 [Gammaproteobacteria bacterium]|nr:hypothetical protein [Gammaproteobacteria bacterium]